jgi:integrase
MEVDPMTASQRVKVEPGIWQRGDVYEITFRDTQGKQRRRTVRGGITAARNELAKEVAKRANGERVTADPRLRFDQAADEWLAGPVAALRPNTISTYRGAVEGHLRKRIGKRRMDDLTPDDIARVVAEMRAAGYSEWTISTTLMVCGQVFRHAARRMGWRGTSPTTLLERGERPHISATAKRRIFRGDELPRTIAAGRQPFKTMFAMAAVTARRESEVLAVLWREVDLGDEPEIRFTHQVDRHGRRVPLKTDGAGDADLIAPDPIPPALAAMLTEHKLRSPDSGPDDFVFATRNGTAINQRNVLKALRAAMKAAAYDDGRPVFPVLHELDDNGKPVKVPRNAVPCFHSFRHTAASQAFADGERVEEVAWLLRHASANTTRSVYLHEIRDAEAKAQRRARMAARMAAWGGNEPQQAGEALEAETVVLQAFRDTPQQAESAQDE